MRIDRRVAIGALTVMLAVAGIAMAGTSSAQPRDARAVWNLTQVAQTCQQTASASQAGIVEVRERLVDANKRVTIPVPCVIHLNDGASVSLANVQVTGRTLNIHDRDTGARRSAVSISGSTFTTSGAESGLLIELNDADDTLSITGTTVTAPRGVLLRVAGMRGSDNSGGAISIARSTFLAEGAETDGITVVASDQTGRISMTDTVLDTPGQLTVLAGRCSAAARGSTLNCSADQVARNLGN